MPYLYTRLPHSVKGLINFFDRTSSGLVPDGKVINETELLQDGQIVLAVVVNNEEPFVSVRTQFPKDPGVCHIYCKDYSSDRQAELAFALAAVKNKWSSKDTTYKVFNNVSVEIPESDLALTQAHALEILKSHGDLGRRGWRSKMRLVAKLAPGMLSPLGKHLWREALNNSPRVSLAKARLATLNPAYETAVFSPTQNKAPRAESKIARPLWDTLGAMGMKQSGVNFDATDGKMHLPTGPDLKDRDTMDALGLIERDGGFLISKKSRLLPVLSEKSTAANKKMFEMFKFTTAPRDATVSGDQIDAPFEETHVRYIFDLTHYRGANAFKDFMTSLNLRKHTKLKPDTEALHGVEALMQQPDFYIPSQNGVADVIGPDESASNVGSHGASSLRPRNYRTPGVGRHVNDDARSVTSARSTRTAIRHQNKTFSRSGPGGSGLRSRGAASALGIGKRRIARTRHGRVTPGPGNNTKASRDTRSQTGFRRHPNNRQYPPRTDFKTQRVLATASKGRGNWRPPLPHTSDRATNLSSNRPTASQSQSTGSFSWRDMLKGADPSNAFVRIEDKMAALGYDVNQLDKRGHPLIAEAVIAANVDLVRYLISERARKKDIKTGQPLPNANVSIKTSKGSSLLKICEIMQGKHPGKSVALNEIRRLLIARMSLEPQQENIQRQEPAAPAVPARMLKAASQKMRHRNHRGPVRGRRLSRDSSSSNGSSLSSRIGR